MTQPRSRAIVALVVCIACGACASGHPAAALPAERTPVVVVAPPDAHSPVASAPTQLPPRARASDEDVDACQDRILRVLAADRVAAEGNEYAHSAGEQRAHGDLRAARQLYFELIQKYPHSAYVPLAYFAFGEMFLAEAAGDPSKADLAHVAFDETLKYPPPRNTAYLLARFRLGKTFELVQRTPETRATYQRAVDEADAHPDWECAAAVEEAARAALTRLGPEP